MKKTKEELFQEITPIEWAGMFKPEVVRARLKNWSIKGLELLKDFWHKHYTSSAHRLICTIPMAVTERCVDFKVLDDILCGYKDYCYKDLDKSHE